MPGVTHIRYPDVYRGCSGGAQDAEAFALGCARFIEEKLFKTTLAPEEVAAIFVEPIQGEGGYVVAPTPFMQELRRICDRHGILLVVDEVQSGIGRTGKWWAVEHTGVQPDIVCMREGHCVRHAAGRHHDAGRKSWTGSRAPTLRPSAATRSVSRPRWPRSTSSRTKACSQIPPKSATTC